MIVPLKVALSVSGNITCLTLVIVWFSVFSKHYVQLQVILITVWLLNTLLL